MAILASPRDRLAAAFGAALLCHGALLLVERVPPQTPEPAAPATLTIRLAAPLQPLTAATAATESPPPAPAQEASQAAPTATRRAKESPALAERVIAPPQRA